MPILARSDSAGATHAFAAALRQRRICFSLGYYVDERVGEAAVALPRTALAAGARRRRQPPQERLGRRADRPRRSLRLAARHAADRAQGAAAPRRTAALHRHRRHRYTCFITDQPDTDIAELERRHRLYARVEDRIQESQQLGLGRLPFHALQPNLARVELALLAQDLLAWLRLLALDGELALAKPKRLRHRLLHLAGRITGSGRRRTLHLPRAWPWAKDLLAAFARLRALTAPG